MMSKTSIKLHRQQGEDTYVHAPWPPRCDTCRKLNAGPSSSRPLSRRSGGGSGSGAGPPVRQRRRPSFAYYLVAALTIASTALSSVGSWKLGGAPLAVVAAVPVHHSSTHRGSIASIATLFLSTEAMQTSGSVLHPPLASARSVLAALPPNLVTTSEATLAHEDELKFKTARFLQSVEDSDAHDEADHDVNNQDHAEDEDYIIQENQQEEEKLPWGQVIGATFLVSLATLSGLLIIAAVSAYRGILKLRGKLNDGDSNNEQSSILRDICIFAFAAGALTATAVFLVLPEALHLIGGEF